MISHLSGEARSAVILRHPGGLVLATILLLGACSGDAGTDAGPDLARDLAADASADLSTDLATDPPADGRADAGPGTDALRDGASDAGGDGAVDASTLTLATWNLRGYPASAEAPEHVAAEVARLGLDLLAVAEVTDPAALGTLAAELGDYDQALVPAQAPADENQLGLLWRAATVSVSALEPLFTDDPEVFPRPAVLARVTPAAAPSAPFDVIAVHLKAGTDPADELQRAEAVARLETFVRGRGEAALVRLLVLGDFNVAPKDPMAQVVMGPFLDDPGRYDVLTWDLAKAGGVTFLPAQIMLDHAVATRALSPALATPVIPPLDERIAGYETAVSDHLPVVLTLTLPR